jgi:hypothetical protein
MEAMQEEQGSPSAGATSLESGPVTALGSDMLKLMAARYADHPDYRVDRRPGLELPGL